jgi:hypothetical protein
MSVNQNNYNQKQQVQILVVKYVLLDSTKAILISYKCLKFGHHTYQCSNARPYQARPSRTQQLEKGKFGLEGPSVDVPEEFKKDAKVGLADRILQAKEEERKRLKALEDKKNRKALKGKGKEKAR